MREILFRGKRKDNGEWIDGFYFFDECALIVENLSYSLIKNKQCQLVGVHPIISETVGQYTGLTDKNGKKIFEGDLCLCDRNISTRVDKQVFTIIFDDEDGAWVGTGWSSSIEAREFSMCEIIGNIHDNPELLGAE